MSTAEYYLQDVLRELLDRGREAKTQAAGLRSRADIESAFADGRSAAYYEVMSYLISQLDVFGIDRTTVRLPSDLDVERELI